MCACLIGVNFLPKEAMPSRAEEMHLTESLWEGLFSFETGPPLPRASVSVRSPSISSSAHQLSGEMNKFDETCRVFFRTEDPELDESRPLGRTINSLGPEEGRGSA